MKTYYFNRDIILNSSLDKTVEQAVEHILKSNPDKPHNRRKIRICVAVVIFNLVCAARKNCHISIAYSRDNNSYRAKDPANINGVSRKTIEVIDILGKTGYIQDMKNGFNDRTNPKKSRPATMKPGPKILDLIDDPDFEFTKPPSKPFRPIILRDGEKNEVAFEPTPETERMAANLEFINARLATYKIELYADDDTQHRLDSRVCAGNPKLRNVPFEELPFPWDADNTQLYRVFNNSSFDYGGRFFGHWIQDIYARGYNFRQHLHINGEQAVELDFSNLQPHILYQQAGLTPPEGDLYQVDIADYIDRRSIVKVCLNTLINMKNASPKQGRAWSINAAAKECFGDKQDKKGIKSKPIVTEIVDKLLVKHAAIKHLFFQDGSASALQRLESDIAEVVLLDLMGRDIPVVPIHDAFVTQKKHKDELEEAMKNAYRKVVGAEPPRIKRT